MTEELVFAVASAGSIMFLAWHMARQEKEIREMKERLGYSERRLRSAIHDIESVDGKVFAAFENMETLRKQIKREKGNERHRNRAVRDIGSA